MRVRLRQLLAWVAMVAGLAVASVAHGGGQFVGDTGAQGMQRAGAFTAKADDATALYYNPAGLGNVQRPQLFVGLNLVHMAQAFERSGSYGVSNPMTGRCPKYTLRPATPKSWPATVTPYGTR